MLSYTMMIAIVFLFMSLFMPSFILAQNQQYIVEWFNTDAEASVCDSAETIFSFEAVTAAVDTALEQNGFSRVGSWILQQEQEGINHTHSRRRDERGLTCTDHCTWLCKNQPYLCIGACSGCRRRRLQGNTTAFQDDTTTLIDTMIDGCKLALSTNLNESWSLSTKCRAALVDSSCRVKVV